MAFPALACCAGVCRGITRDVCAGLVCAALLSTNNHHQRTKPLSQPNPEIFKLLTQPIPKPSFTSRLPLPCWRCRFRRRAAARGLYRDNAFVTTTWLGNDAVTLFLAIPILVCRNGVFTARLAQGAAHLAGRTGLHAVQLRLLPLRRSLQRLLPDLCCLVRAVDLRPDLWAGQPGCRRNPAAIHPATPVKWIGGYFLFVAVGLSADLRAQSMAFIAHRAAPRHCHNLRTPHQRGLCPGSDAAHPVAGGGGIVVDQAPPWGYVIAGILSVKGPLYTLVLGVNSVLVMSAGLTETSELPLWGTLTVLGLIAGALLFGNMKSTLNEPIRKERTMTAKDHPTAGTELSQRTSNQVGLYSSVLTALLTIVTFGFAITAIPISGANCREGCIEYPYLNTVSQFPKDYLWMIPAIILMLAYVIWMVSIHAYAAQHKKIFGQIGLVFAIMAALILLSDYFIQFSVVPVSLMSGETEGITLLTQYNAHGIFIVLEELGYLLMSLSFVFIAPVFSNSNRLENSVRWIFIGGFVLAFVALAIFSAIYGLDRQDRFEVAIISIDWLVLIVNGILLSMVFKKQLRGRKQMNNKILVTYASRFGSTAGVAEAIGKTLAEHGAQVDVLPMKEVKDLSALPGCGCRQRHQRRGMAAGSDAVRAGAPGRAAQQAFRSFPGVHDPEHEKRRAVPQPCCHLAEPGTGAGEAGQRGAVRRGAGYRQNPIFQRPAEVSPERAVWRLERGRSP